MEYLHPQFDRTFLHAVSALGLAHIGDAVFEVMVRTYLCGEGRATNKSLHKATVSHVNAAAQAAYGAKILPMLTPEEQDIFRRGRNAAPHVIPQNASRSDYRQATALESLFGYLFLSGQERRLEELFAYMMEGD